MRILIVGAGAVGCYLGGHLAQAGHDITLLGRQPLAEAVAGEGLVLVRGPERQPMRPLRVLTSFDQAADGPGYDWIAFTMKAYDTVPAIFQLQQHIPDPQAVVSFQNGVGNEESLRDAFGADRVIGAAMTTAVSMPRPGMVVEEQRRGLAVAADSPHAARVVQAFEGTGLAVQTVPRTDSLKWSKLLLNLMGNATSAILDLSPGEIYRDPRLFAVERGALVEALAIMKWLDIPVIDLPAAPTRWLPLLVERVPPFVSRPILQRQIASGRGEKLPSLQAALRAGRRKTEAAWLNGAVAQAADRMQRVAPINHALALTVSDIAAGRASWEMFRHKPEMLLAAIRATQ